MIVFLLMKNRSLNVENVEQLSQCSKRSGLKMINIKAPVSEEVNDSGWQCCWIFIDDLFEVDSFSFHLGVGARSSGFRLKDLIHESEVNANPEAVLPGGSIKQGPVNVCPREGF